MEKMMKTNAFIGRTLMEMNTDYSEDEFRSMMNATVGQIADALSSIKGPIRNMTVENQDEETMKRILNRALGHEVTAEEGDALVEEFIRISELFAKDDP